MWGKRVGDELEGVSIRSAASDAKEIAKETTMADPKIPPKSPLARETQGEGAPKRKRNEGTVTAEELAEPERGNERADGHMIERKRDAHNPEGP
jgi:hypothetical protein